MMYGEKTKERAAFDIFGRPIEQRIERVVLDKEAVFGTFLHYSDPTARKERTVFGAASDELFYNYDDRLLGEKKWTAGLKIATAQAVPATARFYEIALNHFHDTDTVDLKHIILGCNMSNGCSYLVFGYTYDYACDGCRYWSKQCAQSIGCSPMEALCFNPCSPKYQRMTLLGCEKRQAGQSVDDPDLVR